jgi:hypothetical protein
MKKKLDEKYELWMKNVFIDENAKKSKQNCQKFNLKKLLHVRLDWC